MIDIYKDAWHIVILITLLNAFSLNTSHPTPHHHWRGERRRNESYSPSRPLPGSSIHSTSPLCASHILYLTHLAILWGKAVNS